MANPDLVSSVELVYQRTRRAILTGDHPPGSALRLQELAARHGVSMIPVREALRMLEAEGFVESIPNRGARVSPLSMDDMLDVYRTRIVLEMEALRAAAPQITSDGLASARWYNARITHQFVERGYASYDDHRAFHFCLYEPSKSKWLLKLIAIVWDHTERYRRIGAVTVNAQESHQEHELIVAMLESGRTQNAVEALRQHLQNSVDRLVELYEADDSIFTGKPKSIEPSVV